LYGGKENLHFSAEKSEFKDLVYTNRVYVTHITVGSKVHKAIMKEIQFHPVSDEINHIDFIEVSDDKPLIVELPIDITGNSAGIRAGGKLRQRKKYIKVKGLIKDLPDTLTIDISELNIGESILAGNLKYDNIEVLEPNHALVVGVISSRAVKGTEGEGAEGEAAAEKK
jgi:large subunit ribosomal protein L25